MIDWTLVLILTILFGPLVAFVFSDRAFLFGHIVLFTFTSVLIILVHTLGFALRWPFYRFRGKTLRYRVKKVDLAREVVQENT